MEKDTEYMYKLKDKYEKSLKDYQKKTGKISLDYFKIENERIKSKLQEEISNQNIGTLINLNLMLGVGVRDGENMKLDKTLSEYQEELEINTKIKKYYPDKVLKKKRKN